MSENIERGGCLCGQFTYSFDRSAVQSGIHCHCRDCQKSTGSGKATIAFVPKQALSVQGELKYFSVTCNDPALSAQVRPLMYMPQRVFSSPMPGEGVGCCTSRSSR